MRHTIGAIAMALVAWAQSPHVYRPELLDTWEDVPMLTGSGSNSSRPLFHIKPLTSEPTTKQQEDRTPPSFPYPGCFLCPVVPEGNRQEAEFLKFTTERFIELRRTTNYEVELRDTCVFYTRNTTHPKGLSRGATELACQYDKYSIWHLWPNAKNAYDTRNNDVDHRFTNLYGIHTKGETLNYIANLDPFSDGKPKAIWYFENMSRAMARMCSGQIYLVTDMREALDLTLFKRGGRYWPNIWASTEWPELGNGIAARRVSDGFLIVIDFVTIPYPRPVAWKVDWRKLTKTADMGTMWTRSNGTHGSYRVPEDWEPYDLNSELRAKGASHLQLERRATCMEDTGIDSEPPGMDFFG